MGAFDFEKFSNLFPSGIVPEKIKQLCDFEQSGPYEQYAGEFLLDSDENLLDHETGSGIHFVLESDRFLPFGTDYTGGVFAFWSGDDLPISDKRIESCPVVYIDSEAVYSTVLASELNDFLRLLTLSLDNLGDCAAQGVDLDCQEGNEESRLFRNWVKKTLKLEPLGSGVEIVRSAKIKYQDNFFQWYKRWQGEMPWTKYETSK